LFKETRDQLQSVVPTSLAKPIKKKEAMSDARQVLTPPCRLPYADVPYVDREMPRALPDTVNV
jgi:hypothetical protein